MAVHERTTVKIYPMPYLTYLEDHELLNSKQYVEAADRLSLVHLQEP